MAFFFVKVDGAACEIRGVVKSKNTIDCENTIDFNGIDCKNLNFINLRTSNFWMMDFAKTLESLIS